MSAEGTRPAEKEVLREPAHLDIPFRPGVFTRPASLSRGIAPKLGIPPPNDVVELLDDRGIVPTSVAGVYGDDDEQRHGREFEPMVDDPFHLRSPTLANFQ